MFGKRSIDVCAWEEVEEMEEMEEPRGRERIGERVYDKDENRRNARAWVSSISSLGAKTTMRACVSRKVRCDSDAACVGGYPRRAKHKDAFRLRIASSSAMQLWCARALRVSGGLPRARTRTVKRLSGRKNKPSERTGRAFGGARAYLEPLGQT